MAQKLIRSNAPNCNVLQDLTCKMFTSVTAYFNHRLLSITAYFNHRPSPSPVITWGHVQLCLLTGKYTNPSEWHFPSNGTVEISLPFAKFTSFQSPISRKQLQMVSSISLGWVADVGKTVTIIHRSSQPVYSNGKHPSLPRRLS